MLHFPQAVLYESDTYSPRRSPAQKGFFLEGGEEVLLPWRNGILTTWRWREAGRGQDRLVLGKPVYGAALSPDRQLLAVGGKPGLRRYDLLGQQIVSSLAGESFRGGTLEWSPTGDLLAVGGKRRTVTLLEVASDRVRFLLGPHRGHVLDLAFSPDSEFLVSLSGFTAKANQDEHQLDAKDFAVNLWRLATGQNELHVNMLAIPRSVVFTKAGAYFYVTAKHRIYRFSLAERSMVDQLQGEGTLGDWFKGAPPAHASEIACVVLSPDGRFLVSAGWRPLAGEIPDNATAGVHKVWRVSDGRQLAQIEHDRPVRAVDISPDGQFLLVTFKERLEVWVTGFEQLSRAK